MRNLRDLPSVDQLWREIGPIPGVSSEFVKDEIRSLLAERRAALQTDSAPSNGTREDLARELVNRVKALVAPSLRRVINATGVILHTNLGRAPLPSIATLDGYTNLEYNLVAGRRGRRDDHLAPLLERLLGRSAIVVNNNAAAVLLILHELAGGGREVIVSRGELIEIGDGFRIPAIMTSAGANLREVGTTNRTHLADYEDALHSQTGLILRVHRSNFHLTGFTSRPALSELAALASQHKVPLYEDLGSGCVVDLRTYGISEPLVADSFAAGVNLVSFSCDKLLGGPQAGIIAGDGELVRRIRRNPMYRALRIDKLAVQAMHSTLVALLAGRLDEIPALRMIIAPLETLHARATRFADLLQDFSPELRRSESLAGGGSTPDCTLPSWVVALTVPDANRFVFALRHAPVPVIARLEHGTVLLDMRTVGDAELPALVDAVRFAVAN